MRQVSNRSPQNSVSRRSFLVAASALGLAAPPGQAESEPTSSEPGLKTGNGEWVYRTVPGWGHLPAGIQFGGTHGGIVVDAAGLVYISTQSTTGILVYRADGALVRTIAPQYPEVHSMVCAQERGEEYIYATVQKGTPEENWLFVKLRTDGTVVQKIKAPPEAGFAAPNDWRLTAAVPAPDGSIWIANGYGDSRLFRFDGKGNFKGGISGKGSAEGLLDCSHGLTIDTRYGQPLLLICDRENRRLCHFDLDGKYVQTVTRHLRRPCQASIHGDYVIVSELEGRVTILDLDNAAVAFLGDNPRKAQWANYNVNPGEVSPEAFCAAHGCFIDREANIYASDWNQTGRITKLIRVSA
jgi:DNA-binding beta-propeller fold protein YncE